MCMYVCTGILLSYSILQSFTSGSKPLFFPNCFYHGLSYFAKADCVYSGQLQLPCLLSMSCFVLGGGGISYFFYLFCMYILFDAKVTNLSTSRALHRVSTQSHFVAAASAFTSRAPEIICEGEPAQVYIENGHRMV